MTTELTPGWRWENFEHLRSTVVTAPNGVEYELRPGDIAHPRAQRLLDAMFAALTLRPAAQEVAAVKTLETLGYTYHGGELWKPPLGDRPAAQAEREAWVPYLVDRADGVKGHYAIGRWNPRGYREVWNLHSHRWAAYSDDVMSLEEADSLLRQITIPTVPASLPTHQQATPEPVHHASGMTADELWLQVGRLRAQMADAGTKATPEPVGEPAGYTFVQPVPEQCDRIIWRGQYIHLPITRPAPGVPEGVLADMQQFAKAGAGEYLGPNHMALVLKQKINEWVDALAAAQAKGGE